MTQARKYFSWIIKLDYDTITVIIRMCIEFGLLAASRGHAKRHGVETCVKFYISGNQLKVAWTSYEPVGNGNWEYQEYF